MSFDVPDGSRVFVGRHYAAVVPIGDVVLHEIHNSACACAPKVIFGGAGWRAAQQILWHHAADGRPV